MDWKLFIDMFLVLAISLLLLWFASYLSGCGAVGPAGDPDNCEAACERLAELQCDGWRGSPGRDREWGTADDADCETICRDVVKTGIPMNQKCVARVATCEELGGCLQ